MRIGRFLIGEQIVRDVPKLALQILQGLIVIRCEHKWSAGAFEYEAIGEQFDPVKVGECVGDWTVEIRDLVGGKYHVTWIRL